jgi:hypothetical protein
MKTGYNTAPYNTTPFNYAVPASETKEGKERLRVYYEALGGFIDMFARVETAITLTLWAYAKTNQNIAKIIFAGAKIEISSKYIKQLADVTDSPKETRDDLDAVLQQLSIINGVRNDIVHFGATSITEGRAIVSNALKAKGKPTVFPISPTALDNMTADLLKIIFHLNYRHLGRSIPLSAFVLDALDKVLHSPWRYKHPVPPRIPSNKAEHQSSRKRGPKLPRQP